MSAALLEAVLGASAGFSGAIGVWARRLPAGPEVAFAAEEPFETASAIKTLILAAAMRRVAEGADDLAAPLSVGPEHRVLGSGVLRELSDGVTLTLRDVLTLMIAFSDNIATNMVIDRVGGVEAVNTEAARQGMAATRLLARLDFASGANDDGFGVSTPREMGELYVRLYRGACVGPEADAAMRAILLRQQSAPAINRYLPYALMAPPEAPGDHPPLRIASKSGSWEGCRVDCGILYGPAGDFVVSLWSKGCADLRFHPDNEALLVLARISRVLWDAWGGAGPAAG